MGTPIDRFRRAMRRHEQRAGGEVATALRAVRLDVVRGGSLDTATASITEHRAQAERVAGVSTLARRHRRWSAKRAFVCARAIDAVARLRADLGGVQ